MLFRSPVVVARAADFGVSGTETPEELGADAGLSARVQAVRLAAGALMGLGDVSGASVPKITLVSAPADGGTIATRTFIPVRPHTAIGVLGAISVATALLVPGAVGADLARLADVEPGGSVRLDIEHPSGHLEVEVGLDTTASPPMVRTAGVIRTARKLFDGIAYPT